MSGVPARRVEASTVLGYPVTEIEDMPDIAASAAAIAFGDFRKGYLIVDRQGARVLARPIFGQTLCLVLHNQTRRRRRAEL